MAVAKVICCYHDMEGLVMLSTWRATRLYSLVYPRDTWDATRQLEEAVRAL